jgi:SAM-dependent methyltransferase
VSLGYRVMYRVGFTPWERAAEGGADRTAAAQLGRLLDREEKGVSRPLGRALDLGCGTGTHTRELAARGWDVTGVDNVALALKKARERTTIGVAQFVEGDVTRLGELDAGSFDFFLDIGCFHGLRPAERPAMAAGVTGIANQGASLLMLAFERQPAPLMPAGATLEDIAGAFDAWTVIDQEPADTSGMPRPLRKAAPQFYRLQLR